MIKADKDRIVDYFESWELVEFLRLRTEDVIDSFEDEIEEALEEINELMDYGDKDAEV